MLPRIHLVLAFFLLSIAILKTTGSNAQYAVRAVTTPASCSGQSDGSISLQVTGTPPYKFEWSNGANTQNITSLMAGNYKVKITDAKGATAITSAEVKIQAIFDLKITLHEASLSSQGKDVAVFLQGYACGRIQKILRGIYQNGIAGIDQAKSFG